jgi:hypothetical protein
MPICWVIIVAILEVDVWIVVVVMLVELTLEVRLQWLWRVLDIMRDTLNNKLISNYYELPTYIRV